MDASTALFFSYAANVVAQFADSFLTAKAISAKGLKNEGNPITRKMIEKLGVAGAAGVKIGALPFVGLAIEAISGYPGAFNGTVAAVTSLAVVWNVIQLKREKISIF